MKNKLENSQLKQFMIKFFECYLWVWERVKYLTRYIFENFSSWIAFLNRGATSGGKKRVGGLFCPFSNIEKVSWNWEKNPWLCSFMGQIFHLICFLRVYTRKTLKFFPAFLSCVEDEERILANLARHEKFLVASPIIDLSI